MEHYNDRIGGYIDAMDLSQPPPEDEAFRQYYFIKKAREHVKRLEEQLGRKPYACLVSFGCQMNTKHEITKKPQPRGFLVLRSP